ncbi:MAG: TPM domain-containing protein [Alphaproteobacteria bacterium]|nr:TPM domain-containing protein [Alphaproteobacteria bacterium]
MTILSPAQRQRIEAAIRTAESGTSAEFLCAVARSTDTYFTVPLILSAVVGVTAPAVALHLAPGWTGVTLSDPGVAIVQLLVFALVALATTRPRIAAWLTPRAVLQRRAARFAAAVFLERGLAGVEARNGVLLFVSLAEHHVEVIADRGVFAVVDPAQWMGVVEGFTAQVARGDVAEAYVAALERLGAILAAAFPRAPDDANEIPDRLLELD